MLDIVVEPFVYEANAAAATPATIVDREFVGAAAIDRNTTSAQNHSQLLGLQ